MTAASPAKTQPKKQLLAWQSATWDEYVRLRDHSETSEVSRVKLFFSDGALLVDDMGWEGINHATVRELLLLMLGFWLAEHPQPDVNFMGGCLLEKEGEKAASPDLLLYAGEGFPIWKKGETRKIDLSRWRVPELVCEISETTLASDLDDKKQLYAALGISEYWVIDVRGSQAFFFRLGDQGQYHEVKVSSILSGLDVGLLEEAISKLDPAGNMEVALWFQKQIAQAK